MKKLILLFLLMISGVTFAQKEDEILDFVRDSIPLTGAKQQISVNIYQKNIVIDNTGGDTPVYLYKMRNGIVDTTKNFRTVKAGEERTFYNPADTAYWIKGTAGKYVIITIESGRGRGFQKSPGSSTNGVQYSDSTTKYYTPAQFNTAIASYYTKTQAHSLFLEQADSVNILRGSDSLSKYATPKSVRDYTGDTSLIGHTNQNESITGKWNISDSLTVGPALISRVNSARIKINKSVDADTLRPNHLIVNGGTAITANTVNTSFVTIALSGAVNFQSRGQIQTPADGSFLLMNWNGNNFTRFELGAGNYTTGFYHGTVDTDITSVYLRSPNGTLYYITVSDAGVISASTTAP